MADKRDKNIIVNSSLWAAFGDALGFITELADERTLRHRVHSDEVTETVEWRRNIGGRFGTTVELPRGCYSDDTQLRLATSRAIRGDGYFDVEAFAKIELPVWRSYALGAGRSTKAAASALAHIDVSWFSNFFKLKDVSYLEAGGNGAAMRIQPHVWANKSGDAENIIRDVIRNSVCTHGHIRAIAGACFHALCLHSAICTGNVPGLHQWHGIVAKLSDITNVVSRDNELSAFWLPVWEQRSKSHFDEAIQQVQIECREDIERIASHLSEGNLSSSYKMMLEATDALQPSKRGSGTKTAILASALSWLYRNHNPKDALVTAANQLSSDTDTIATMAGAILGLTNASQLESTLLDRNYLVEEADRLYQISTGNGASSFSYPDLLSWTPPRNLIDVVHLVNDSINVSGLGTAEAVGPPRKGRKDEKAVWQWLKLRFGQSILVKGRAISQAGANNVVSSAREKQPAITVDQPRLFSEGSGQMINNQSHENARSLDLLTAEAIKSGFDHQIIGMHLMKLAERPEGIELAIAYAAIIAKAKRARIESQSKKVLEHKPV